MVFEIRFVDNLKSAIFSGFFAAFEIRGRNRGNHRKNQNGFFFSFFSVTIETEVL